MVRMVACRPGDSVSVAAWGMRFFFLKYFTNLKSSLHKMFQRNLKDFFKNDIDLIPGVAYGITLCGIYFYYVNEPIKCI